MVLVLLTSTQWCNTGYSLPHMKCSTQSVKIEFSMIVYTKINACVANGGWVLKDLGTDPNNPNPGRWDTRISLPYPQPSHEPRPPPQTPNQAPVTLNSTFNGETIEEKPLPPRIGRGGRGKTRKHTNATTPNAEPSQSHEAMRQRTSNTQRSR